MIDSSSPNKIKEGGRFKEIESDITPNKLHSCINFVKSSNMF